MAGNHRLLLNEQFLDLLHDFRRLNHNLLDHGLQLFAARRNGVESYFFPRPGLQTSTYFPKYFASALSLS